MRVLFLTHRLPYAPNRGDRIRAYHLLAAFRREFEVDLVFARPRRRRRPPEPDDGPGRHAGPCGPSYPRAVNYVKAALHLPTARPLTLELLHSPAMPATLRRVVGQHPDVVVAYCSSMARYALEPPLAGCPFILDMVDVDSQKWAALARRGTSPLRLIYLREARCLARFEREAVARAALTLAVNEREERSVRQLVPAADVRIVPNGIDVRSFRRVDGAGSEPAVVFCGVMNYAPNIEAAMRLAQRIWPLVRASRPDAVLRLVGAEPTPELRRMAGPGIEVTGSVPDVRPYLWRAAVAAVPLITARGIQNKALEALAAGLPTVVSPAVAEGLPESALQGCRVAATDAAFAETIVEFLGMPDAERRGIAARASLDSLSWERQLSGLGDLVRAAAESRRS